MARPESLGISAELATELRAWADWHDAHSEYGGQHPATGAQRRRWFSQGRMLAQRLSDETGADVVYQWPSGGADAECPHCGTSANRGT